MTGRCGTLPLHQIAALQRCLRGQGHCYCCWCCFDQWPRGIPSSQEERKDDDDGEEEKDKDDDDYQSRLLLITTRKEK